MSANSGRFSYTRMIRAVALWEAELGWSRQKARDEECEKLQYQALKKYIDAKHASKGEPVSQIAGVESLRIMLNAAQARILVKLIRNPSYMDNL